ncbi:MAG TPA: hypothetical protein VG323_18215 [Thermoanaerobaculia bacterium]|nr:hypothetical protein [Thermoanaerobaculia bacterium]
MRPFIIAALLLGAACATRPPTGEPLAPVKAATADEALRILEARAGELQGARSLMRMRATVGDRVQSFKAQLQIDSHAMLLTAYTPLNTTAMRVYADDSGVVFTDDLERTAWQGSAAEFARNFGFFGDLAPRDAAKLLIGLPASKAAAYEATPAGLARATSGDVAITYTPPSFPPSRITVARGARTLEIESLGTVASSDRVEPLRVPAGYRCCVAPKL